MSRDLTRRRRIVITLDSAQVSTADLELLTRLALRTGADLEGVFVEDSDLLRLAESSFLRELRPTSQRAAPFQAGRMRQELRATARRAERLLAQHAEHRGVHWSFRTWRGSIERELLSGVQADVLALMRLGAVTMPSARRRAPEVVAACYDGSEESGRALATAADLAADNDQVDLQVLLAGELATDTEPGPLRRQAAKILSGHRGRVAYRTLDDETAAGLLGVLRDTGCTALVLQRDNALLRDTPLREYLSHLHCPLFLVS